MKVELDKVCFFLRSRVQKYISGYDCEEFDFESMYADLTDYFEHPEKWHTFIRDYPNPESTAQEYLDNDDEIKKEIDDAEIMLAQAKAHKEQYGAKWREAWAVRWIPIFEAMLKGER
jgi:hypothetical protein